MVQPELGWITGVLFEREGTALLAEISPKGDEIVLRARGPERKELLSVIANELDALNETFHGLRDKVGKWVPCICAQCRTLAEPRFFEQKELLRRKEHGKLKVECPGSFADVDVLEMLDGLRLDQPPPWAKQPRTLKIFLASSAELRDDRDAFELYFRQQNDRLRKQGIDLQIIRWENFLDAMSETRLQDEYNREVRACDLFVSLFFTKTGKYTEDEFDTAHCQFQDTGKPLIWTYFKDAPVNMGSIDDEVISLLQFKKKLAELGHFYSEYSDIEHLKRQFRDQLDKLPDHVL